MIPEIKTDKTTRISQNGTMEKRRHFTPEEKAKIVIEVLREEKSKR